MKFKEFMHTVVKKDKTAKEWVDVLKATRVVPTRVSEQTARAIMLLLDKDPQMELDDKRYRDTVFYLPRNDSGVEFFIVVEITHGGNGYVESDYNG